MTASFYTSNCSCGALACVAIIASIRYLYTNHIFFIGCDWVIHDVMSTCRGSVYCPLVFKAGFTAKRNIAIEGIFAIGCIATIPVVGRC